MKKIGILLLVFMLILGLTACSSSHESVAKSMEAALENSDIDGVLNLMHKEADEILSFMCSDSRYTTYEEYLEFLFEVEKIDCEMELIESKDLLDAFDGSDDFKNMYDALDDIVEENNLDVNTDSMAIYRLYVYCDDGHGHEEDGIMVLCKDGGSWKVVLLVPCT